MLQNSQKGVENIPLTRQVGKWVVVCTAVSTVILGMMAALSCLVLHYPAALFRVLFLTFLAAGFLVSAVFFFLAGRKNSDTGVFDDATSLCTIASCIFLDCFF